MAPARVSMTKMAVLMDMMMHAMARANPVQAKRAVARYSSGAVVVSKHVSASATRITP